MPESKRSLRFYVPRLAVIKLTGVLVTATKPAAVSATRRMSDPPERQGDGLAVRGGLFRDAPYFEINVRWKFGLHSSVNFLMPEISGDSLLYAHTPSDDGTGFQTLDDHTASVAELAAEFAEAFNGEKLARSLGWAHDAGKADLRFQRYLEACARGERAPKCAHAHAGAVAVSNSIGLLALAVAGHHSGIPDLSSWKAICDAPIPKRSSTPGVTSNEGSLAPFNGSSFPHAKTSSPLKC
ncbi:MAG: CRISPR-associated endonuclease Cas3'' [Fimbriimonadaceae bacterium]